MDPPEVLLAVLQGLIRDELRYRAAPSYLLTVQNGAILPWMRQELVEWMIEVGSYFKLHPETVGLAVNYVDRYCSVQSVTVCHYQLAGATALLLASKMRELVPPRCSTLADMCAGACTRRDIKHMERLFLRHLHWDMDSVTPHVIFYHLISFCQLGAKAQVQLRSYAELLFEVVLAALGHLRPDILLHLMAITHVDMAATDVCCMGIVNMFAKAFPMEQQTVAPMLCYRHAFERIGQAVAARPPADTDAQLVPEWIPA